MYRAERQMETSPRNDSDVPRHYRALVSDTFDQVGDVSIRFSALLQRFRAALSDELNRPPEVSRIQVPVASSGPPEILVPTRSAVQDSISQLEAWSPPSPGGSPTEGTANLVVRLRQLLIPNAPQPQPENEEEQNEVPAASPVTDEDTRVCVIDLMEIEPGEQVIRLPCLHVFHAECILGYLRSTPRPQCPLDRIDVPRRVIDSLAIFNWGEPEVVNP